MAKRQADALMSDAESPPRMIALIVDVETTGLPERPPWSTRSYYSPNILEMYDSSRIVSIAWIVRDLVTQTDISECYYVVKPNGFSIPESSTAIHGITHSFAEGNGIPIQTVIDMFQENLIKYQPTYLVAHNLAFDIHVIKSELYRAERKDVLDTMKTMSPICTMRRSRVFMNTNKQPKLVELFKYCFPDQDMPHAHNALHDTRHCCECLQWMYNRHSNEYMKESLWT
jgi:DNA polymerase III epsilon subunit-like protein